LSALVSVQNAGTRLTKSLRTGPMSDVSSSQVQHKFGPKFDLKVICNGFHKIDLKLVSSCLLQYKPVCVR